MLRTVLIVATAAFALLIGIAIMEGGFLEAGSWLMANRWGQVTLADLYFGFFLSAIVISLLEEKPLVAALWIVPIPFLGNLWTALWFIVRLRHLRDRLSRY